MLNRMPTIIEVRIDGTDAEQIAFAQLVAERIEREFGSAIRRDVGARVPRLSDAPPARFVQPR